MDIISRLFELEDLKYKEFASSLTKTRYPFIGVRIPYLKKIAKELKDENLSFFDAKYFEEIMLEGLIIGYIKDIDEVVSKLRCFVSKIDNWSACDSCCANLKITKNNKEKMWEYIKEYKDSNKEFEVRFMIVMMLNYYLEKEYIAEVFSIIDSISCDFYYSNMAISWLLATSLVKLEKETLDYLKSTKVSDFIYNKAISKACDSYKISNELKRYLKKIKR